MSRKSLKLQALLVSVNSRGLDPRYAGYFACFDQGQYFEAHEVLEDLWLEDRRGPDGDYFKGLIQLAGAFVHLQKNRLRPASALLSLALDNLARYPSPHRQLDVIGVRKFAEHWRADLTASDWAVNPLSNRPTPRLDPFLKTTALPSAGSTIEPLPDGSHREDGDAKQ